MRLKRVVAWIALAIPLAAMLALLAGYWLSDNDCGKTAATPRLPMKAVVHCDYGAAEVLRLEDVETPTPGDDELLVRVRAAAVNPLDWHYMRGVPYVMRLGAGFGRPKDTRLGVDFSGTVEAVAGVKVTMRGCRGSIAAPGLETARYGGNTTCVHLETAAGEHLIFDAGTEASARSDSS